MVKSARYAAYANLILNAVLFIAKFVVALSSGSLAVFSDALNSFTDIFSSLAILISVHVSAQRRDRSHPFGHHRAEPIAGLFVAIFTGILAFEILKSAVLGLLSNPTVVISKEVFLVLGLTIIVKLVMYLRLNTVGKKNNSPALLATAIDSRNDVLATAIALIGVVGENLGFTLFDELAAILISVFIFKSGYDVGRKNIDYLMGARPPRELLTKIKETATSVNGVKAIMDVRAHYVGTYVHVAMRVAVKKNISTIASHKIAEEVGHKVEHLDTVDKAFIHIEPA